MWVIQVGVDGMEDTMPFGVLPITTPGTSTLMPITGEVTVGEEMVGEDMDGEDMVTAAHGHLAAMEAMVGLEESTPGAIPMEAMVMEVAGTAITGTAVDIILPVILAGADQLIVRSETPVVDTIREGIPMERKTVQGKP